jgi:hypothetical protein
MAANPKKGRYGNLMTPKKREAQLRKFAHLPLAEAGRRMGVKVERARQLYRLYGVPRKKHKKTWFSGMTLDDLRFRRDLAKREGDLGLAFKCAVAIDRLKGLY